MTSVDCEGRDATPKRSSVYWTQCASSRLSADYIYMQTMERRGRDSRDFVYLHTALIVPSAFLFRGAELLVVVKAIDGQMGFRFPTKQLPSVDCKDSGTEGTHAVSCINTPPASSLPRFCIEKLGSSVL